MRITENKFVCVIFKIIARLDRSYEKSKHPIKSLIKRVKWHKTRFKVKVKR